MSAYSLGVDLGTTYSAAAIARGATSEPLPLGTDSAQVPSVVLIREDGEVLVGDAAERRASAEPTRAAREFKRRLGDPVPIVIGDQPQSVQSLMAHLLRDIVRRATEQEGEPPTTVVLTHPANYSDYKTGLLNEAAELAGLAGDQVILLTEPEAAAIAYSRQARIDNGEIVAVYDFGGGTFDAALVRRTEDRFELIGVPEGMERLGGIDFDQAVMAHVDSTLGGLVSGADRNDPQTRPGQARLRTECRRAKEALSTDSDTIIPVALPGVQTEVRLTRDEFESMVRPRVGETVRALERTVASAHIGIDQVSRILLVGGSSRMPVVAEMLRSATGRPVALDAHPKLAIAVGASLAGAASIGVADSVPVATAARPEWQPPARAVPPAAVTRPSTNRKGRSKGLVYGAVGGGIGVAAVVAALTLAGGDSEKQVSLEATTTIPVSQSTQQVVTTATSPSSEPTTPSSTSPSESTRRGVGNVVTTVSLGEALIADIRALAVDQQGSVYVAGADGSILRSGDGEATSVAPADPTRTNPGGMVVMADGSVLLSTTTGVTSIRDGVSTSFLDAVNAGLGATPGPLALDGFGNLYLADNDMHRIIRRGTDGTLSLVAGSGVAAASGAPVGDGQPAGTVAIGTVAGLAIDTVGNLVFADSATLAIRQVSVDGTLSTVVGGGAVALSSADGSWFADGTAARDLAFLAIDGLTVDGSDRVYVADSLSGAIVRIDGGLIELVIARQADVARVDGVAAHESSIGVAGSLSVDRGGTLYFEDGASLRTISGS